MELYPLLLMFMLQFNKIVAEIDTYSAVVVEYCGLYDKNNDPATNNHNNAIEHVNIINAANKAVQPDIIVFPEHSFRGSNPDYPIEVPDPVDYVTPCDTASAYEPAMVLLSCAARNTKTYVVVNLGEKFYDSKEKLILFFNTDVVFDTHGAVISRYRKIHLFNRRNDTAGHEVGYFDTDFGVRFGLITCYDLDFEFPGTYLKDKYNISHFIFPNFWYSSLPHNIGIQIQWFWSYAENIVLLGSTYNAPSMGVTGSGIFFGRLGPAIYNMSEINETFMLHAHVPKQFPPKGEASLDTSSVRGQLLKYPIDGRNDNKPVEKIHTSNFIPSKAATKLIAVPEHSTKIFNGTELIIPFTMEEFICQNSICCSFSLKVKQVYSRTKPSNVRAYDYSHLHYRLVVLDGLEGNSTSVHPEIKGKQYCSIVSCVNTELSSCGKRSDHSSAQQNILMNLFQREFVFESITIIGNFSNSRSLVGPDVLLTGEKQYLSLLPSDRFKFYEVNMGDVALKVFQTVKPIASLVTASLYGRLFFRDVLPDEHLRGQPSLAESHVINMFLLAALFLIIKYCS